jgi:ketosteroid isomerase-like protein
LVKVAMTTESVTDSGIDELYTAWAEALRRRDLDEIMGLLTLDYVLWPSGAPPQTRDMLRPRLAAALAVYDITASFECEERIVSGGFAFERGWDVQSIRPIAGGEVQLQRQRVFLILQRGDDRKWRFARGMAQPGPPA